MGCKETEEGLKVIEIIERSAAKKARLKKGDIIVKVNGDVIDTREELTIAISTTGPGESVIIDFLRGEKEMTAKVKLGKRPGFEEED